MPPFFPERLYTLTEKDVQSFSLLTPYYNVVSALSGSTGVTASIVLNNIGDRFLFLQHVFNTSNSGAAQFNTSMGISILSSTNDASPANFRLKWKITALALDFLDWQGSILVPPNWTIRAYGNFSAAAAANSVELGVMGALVPRGSIQRL